MAWLKWVIVVLAFVGAGWIAFDGAHGLVTGDYVTPKSGRYAGQLGPWSRVVSAVGLDPRSRLVMAIHLVQGVVWLVILVAFALGARWAWTGMLVCAIAGLWYLPFGTLLSIVQIVLLLLPAVRKAAG